MKCEFCAVASCVPVSYAASTTLCDDVTLGACQELAGGVGGGWKQSQGHNFLRLRKGRGHKKWAVKREWVMKYMPVIM